jgi:hypothetical protein
MGLVVGTPEEAATASQGLMLNAQRSTLEARWGARSLIVPGEQHVAGQSWS